MELIKELYEIEGNYEPSYKIRKAARTILINELNQVALLFVSRDNYHKLPGGGLEGSENIHQALKREVLEEVGAEINIEQEVGMIIEYRNQYKQLQISYCFISRIMGTIKQPHYTLEEQEAGFTIKWVSLEDAIKVLKEDKPTNYVGKFIQRRDLAFLKTMLDKLR